jgi:tRNA nucleotidyltransferase (CCA-adding enzyme)
MTLLRRTDPGLAAGADAPQDWAGSVDPAVLELFRAIAHAGGRALLVGGWVRDRFLARATKDLDIEVHGLPLEALERVLSTRGEVIAVGRAFGVLKVKGLEADISIPRRDSKRGSGHRGFVVDLDPALGYAEAARRRDLTLNSMGFDPLRGEVLDPHGGRADLARGILRATDPVRFADDSLRALRVAQFRARFEMEPDRELRTLSSAMDLSDLPGERIFEELRKLLLQSRKPSLGFEFLRETGLLRFFPELAALVGLRQDPIWHPEGTVWEHTLLVLDEAARERQEDPDEELSVMFGALAHDFGKATTTEEEAGRIRSPGHEEAGVPLAEEFLRRLRAPASLVARTVAFVRHHLAPAHLSQGGATLKAYRRLLRKLREAEVRFEALYRVARADHLGRTTPDAIQRTFPAGDAFLASIRAVDAERSSARDLVLGRHLIGRGFPPSPWFGRVLEECREVQDETGWTEAERILDVALERVPSREHFERSPKAPREYPPIG